MRQQEPRKLNDVITLAERADALEHRMMHELDAIVVRSWLFNLADRDVSTPNGPALLAPTPATTCCDPVFPGKK